MAQALKRLGMLVPSSNTIAEPESAALLPLDGSVTLHVSRLRVVTISDDESSLAQFERSRIAAAVDLLADANVDVILWNGTAASWLGFERDAELVAMIEAQTGIRATTAVIALNAELERLGARRIALITPYVEALETKIVANYGAAGIEVAAANRLDLTENTAYASITPHDIAGMARSATAGISDLDAVLILCTNLAGSSIADQLEAELGIPVLDSVRVAVEHALRLLDHQQTR
jgi:maleate isomerase